MRITLFAGACAALLVGPAVADAATWRGKTRQGHPPLDASTTTSFQDAGGIAWRFEGSGERARGRTSIDGGLRSSGRWTGNFRLRVKIRKNGRVIATCRTGRVGWKARPR